MGPGGFPCYIPSRRDFFRRKMNEFFRSKNIECKRDVRACISCYCMSSSEVRLMQSDLDSRDVT